MPASLIRLDSWCPGNNNNNVHFNDDFYPAWRINFKALNARNEKRKKMMNWNTQGKAQMFPFLVFPENSVRRVYGL